jgi:tRNA dimethylallyltransferase
VTELFTTGRDALQGYRMLLLGLSPPRDALYRQIDARCQQMFDGGLIEEVRGIAGRGYSLDLKPFEAHGYRQAVQVIRGELRVKEAVFYAQRNTRQYAKRQVTWFRADPRIEWWAGFGTDPEIEAAALRRASRFLSEIF